MKKTDIPVYVKALGAFIIGISFLFIETRSNQMLVCFIGSLGVVFGDIFDKRETLKGKAFYLAIEIILAIGFLIAFLKS